MHINVILNPHTPTRCFSFVCTRYDNEKHINISINPENPYLDLLGYCRISQPRVNFINKLTFIPLNKETGESDTSAKIETEELFPILNVTSLKGVSYGDFRYTKKTEDDLSKNLPYNIIVERLKERIVGLCKAYDSFLETTKFEYRAKFEV